MGYQDIELIKDKGIAFLHLNRPKILSAFYRIRWDSKKDWNARVIWISKILL